MLAAERVDQLVGGLSAPGNRLCRHVPDVGHVAAGGRIVNPSVTGKLIGLLPVLAAALAVALAGERAEASADPPAHAERQRDVDVGERVHHALGLLFGSAGRQHHRRRRPSQPMGRVDERRLWHAGDLFDPLGPVRRRDPPRLAEALGPGGDVRLVDHPIANQDVQQAVAQRRVGSGPQLQVQLRPRRGRRPPGIGDDQAAAVALLRLEVLHQRRHRFGGICADEQDRRRFGDVVERKGQAAIDPERAHPGGGRRRHAEPSVVVDVGRAQADAGELADADTPSRWSARRCRTPRPHRSRIGSESC